MTAVVLIVINVTTAASCKGGGNGYVFIPDSDQMDKKVDPKTLLLGVKAIVLKAIILNQVLNSATSTTMMMMLTTPSTTTIAGRR